MCRCQSQYLPHATLCHPAGTSANASTTRVAVGAGSVALSTMLSPGAKQTSTSLTLVQVKAA